MYILIAQLTLQGTILSQSQAGVRCIGEAMTPVGFEPTIYGLEGRRVIQPTLRGQVMLPISALAL